MTTKTLYLVVVVALGLVTVTLAAELENCATESKLADFISAEVSNCTEDDDKCPLHRGTNATISIKFNAKTEIKSVMQVVHGTIAHLAVPFPLQTPDACQGTGLQCPLAVGEHSYQYSLFVKPVYPKVSVEVKWQLQNEAKEDIVCIKIPAHIK